MLKTFRFHLVKGLFFFSVFSLTLPLPSVVQAQTKKKNETVQIVKTEKVSTASGVIRKIEIVGLKKIEKDAVLQKIKTAEGQNLDRNLISQDIQALFQMNYFTQVEVEKEIKNEGLVVTYRFIEKPTVSEIVFEGNSDIKSEDLEAQTGLKNFEVINYTKIQTAIEKIEKHYEDKGFYLAKVESLVEDDKPNETVRIKFKITENEKVKVKKKVIRLC